MTERAEHITQLIVKESNELLTEEEAAELEAWRKASPKHEAVFSTLTEPASMAEQLRILYSYDNRSMEKRLEDEIPGLSFASNNKEIDADALPKVPFYKTNWLRYAAVVMLVIATGIYFFLSQSAHFSETSQTSQLILNSDLPPATERAILTLADGSQIVLDSADNGVLAEQSNTQVIKLSDGQIVYKQDKSSQGALLLNTISTPRGGQYQLLLPDGSKVYLNAASSITYPAAFIGKERRVAVKGEVYVDVAKNPQMPFVVDVNGKSVIEVLGTSFNINAYPDDDHQFTTLLSGSVRISLPNGNRQAMPKVLRPGEMADINESIKVKQADVEQVLAWRNGIFNFNGKSFELFMREIERWYDVDIKFEGETPAFGMKGEMDRNVKLSEIIQLLKNYGVNVRQEGKTLIIK